jgi:threonine/homoserine/homoserine lactone efflux protein
MVVELLAIGLVIALEPVPLTSFILVLGARHGVRNGLWFIVGWLASFLAVIALVELVTGGTPPAPSTDPSTAIGIVKLVIGIGLIGIGAHRRRRPPRPAKEPRWMSWLDHLSGFAAAGLGCIIQPWPFVAAGAAVITGADLHRGSTYLVLAAFVVVSTSSYLAMEAYAVLRPDSATATLDGIRRWIVTHEDQAIVILAVGIGFWLTFTAIFQLIT